MGTSGVRIINQDSWRRRGGGNTARYNCVDTITGRLMENPEITQLLGEARRGDTDAQSRLAALVYGELHRLAEQYMRLERPEHSLQATVLVHDAFLRLVSGSQRNFENRSHFFAAAAQTMRRILIDYARHHRAEKRGGELIRFELGDVLEISSNRCDEWISVDRALNRLNERDPRLAQIVEMRFFAGMTEEEIAEALDLSERTVKRDWKVAKAWLRAELTGREA